MIPLFVTTCCDNSGLLGIEKEKHPMRFLPFKFSSFVNKSPCQLYFPLHINLVSDLFVLLCYCMLIGLIN